MTFEVAKETRKKTNIDSIIYSPVRSLVQDVFRLPPIHIYVIPDGVPDECIPDVLHPGVHYGIKSCDDLSLLESEITRVLINCLDRPEPLVPDGVINEILKGITSSRMHCIKDECKLKKIGINLIGEFIKGMMMLYNQQFIDCNGNISNMVCVTRSTVLHPLLSY